MRWLVKKEMHELMSGESIQRVYEVRSHLRTRMQVGLPSDIEVLEEHHSDLLEELREIVCEVD